jgi:hypothetical protein
MKPTQNLKKSEKPSLEANGTGFGNQRAVQFKITHKDLILVAGILVAMIIAITTWMLDNPSQSESQQLLFQPKFSTGVLSKIGKVIIDRF